MVATPLAVVLRAKGGNFMIQTYGIPGKLVQDAAAEALDSLQRYRKDGPVSSSPPDSSGDAAPNLALGQVSVLQGRLLVTYRMVNAILVLLISEPTSNAFLCLRVLDACGKVLVGACKGVEVTPERLSKRYADVHASLGSLVAGGLAELPPAFVHSSATSEKLLSAKRIKKLLGTGKGGSATAFIGDKAAEQSEENSAAAMPDTPKREEKGEESADPLALVEFSIPADALPPPPARAVGAKRRPPAPPRVVSVVPTTFKGAVEDESAAPGEAEGFGAFQEVKVLEAEKADEDQGAGSEEWEAAFGETEAEPAPSGPSLSPADLQQALQLVEIYRGEVVAGKLQTAVVDGAVRRKLAPYGLESARFRLLQSDVLVVNACLQTAARHTAYTSVAANDAYVFDAALTGSPMDCCYIKYTLPSVACLPPLQLDLLLAPPSDLKPQPGKALQWEALVVLRYATNPALAGPLLDTVVEVDLPPELSVLVKTSPSARWSPGECRLRWDLGRIEPGTSGLARAVVGAKPGTPADRAAAALRDTTKARVVFSGWPGSSLSGAGLEVAMPGEEAPEFHRGRAQWFAEVVVRP